MAPIQVSNLSCNWKKLQQTLKASSTPAAKKPTNSETDQNSLKRKRRNETHGETKKDRVNGTSKPPSDKQSASRKRQKMEEPPSVGASAKHHDTKALTRSISMPSLKHSTLLSSSKNAAPSLSVLTPSRNYPDIENEGVSALALPGKYIALDCEMVGTGPEPDKDSALARVSAVNFHGHQIYDSYVQVKVPVSDYRTAVSGIEPKHLRKDVARPFKEVHNDLRVLLQGRILVGHAVKNDLDALILRHDKRYIRDTSKYSKFRELAMIPGRTPSLKILAEKLLGVEIQVGAHSSVEDARVAMALFRLEKEGFDTEVIARYGHIRTEATIVVGSGDSGGADTEIGGGEPTKKKSKNKKKKKKKH